MKMSLSALLATLTFLLWIEAANAEVRFGRNVYIGGHDFSHQRYGPGRRLRVHLYDRAPRRAGCRWYPAGSRYAGRRLAAATRVCHLQRR